MYVSNLPELEVGLHVALVKVFTEDLGVPLDAFLLETLLHFAIAQVSLIEILFVALAPPATPTTTPWLFLDHNAFLLAFCE